MQKSFENLLVWQESMQLALEVYDNVKLFKDSGLKDQMCRAAVSVPSNIAEGYERNSDNEFIHFLFIARGSCGELRTQIILVKRLHLISEDKADILIDLCCKVSAMIYNLIKARRNMAKRKA